MSDQSDKMSDKNSIYAKIRRRGFLQKAGGAASAGTIAGLAGCSGDGGDGGGGTTPTTDDGGGGTTPTTDDGGGGTTPTTDDGGGGTTPTTDDSGTPADNFNIGDQEFRWWNYSGTQSDTALEEVERRMSAFEDDTGASVEVSQYGYGDVTGQRWATLFQQEEYPPIFDNFPDYIGRFISFLKPVDEYIDWFSDETQQKFEWLQPTLETMYSGYNGIYEIPYGVKGRMNILVRMDHWEEAGLNPEEFPPDGIDDLIEKATTLQEEGPGDWGYHLVGGKFDILDSDLSAWTVAEGGEDGLFLNTDMSETKIDNDTWKEVTGKYVDIYREHGLSSGGSVSRNDEDNLQRLIEGSVSMATIGMDNWPTALEQAGDLIESGDLQWGTLWGGGIISTYSMYLTKPPSGVDPQEWENKQRAGVQAFEDYWMNEESQARNMDNIGIMPVQQNLWEGEEEDQTNAGEITAQIQLLEKSEYAWRNHEQFPNMIFNVIPPHLHQAYQGEISTDEALDNAAEEVRQLL